MSFWKALKGLLQESNIGGSDEQKNSELPFATAVLLIEVARCDLEISPSEIKVIQKAIRDLYGKSNSEAKRLIHLAAVNAEKLTCHKDFAETINQSFNDEQKEKIVMALWQVAFADGILDRNEEIWVKKLSTLLKVPYSMVMTCKNRLYMDGT